MRDYVEPLIASEILPLLRPSERRCLIAMSAKLQTCSEIGTTGRVLWELNDYRRDERGVSPPTTMVWYDEEYGWRGWALTSLGEQVKLCLLGSD